MCCGGRVVSVLEGGYGTLLKREERWQRATLSGGCVAHVEALCSHARQVQLAHARAASEG